QPSLRGWDALLERALAKDPGARFRSLEEMRQAVSAILVEIELTPALAPAPVEPPPPKQKSERYVVAGELRRTEVSLLLNAEDAQLGRQVVIEQFSAGYFETEVGAAHLQWLRKMARHGGPHLQRVLRIDGDRVVYEAVIGPPPSTPLEAAA